MKEVDVAFVSYDGLASSPEKFVEPDFARQLERENAALRAALTTALGIEAIDDESLSELVSRCKSIIDAARKEAQ